ncbi:hypothetical protein DY000_02037761 [Brassica cretica]|uniref:Uncharacterized protein n=1 Tax=Brassica cretica TaxID=69181 RepID=A0ABQ7BDC4_BRACR|nr:hypothetical protein DY000_02037761 [Brassica cretica]
MEATKETNPKDDSVLVREEGVENVDPKDHVVVLDSSSEEQDDGDQVKKTEETVEEEGTSADDKGGDSSVPPSTTDVDPLAITPGLPGVLVCSNRLRRSGGLRAVEENAKIAHVSVELVSKITVGTFRMLFEDMTIGRVTLELTCLQR